MPDRSPQLPATVVRNNMAIVVWIFMAVWMGMLGLFTYIFVRDGSPPEVGAFGVPLLGLFWLVGLGATGWAFAQPLIRVAVSPLGVVVRQRWLWTRRERRFDATALAAPTVVTDKDSDGDPYFKCLLTLPGGEIVTVRETHDRASANDVQRRLAAALALA